MVDNSDFEPAVRAGGGDIVLLDKGANNPALDLIFVARDTPHPGFTISCLSGTLNGACERVFVAVLAYRGRDAKFHGVRFVRHGLSANTAACQFR
jgi:hypothetical protein